jgi:hypothetical protein
MTVMVTVLLALIVLVNVVAPLQMMTVVFVMVVTLIWTNAVYVVVMVHHVLTPL